MVLSMAAMKVESSRGVNTLHRRRSIFGCLFSVLDSTSWGGIVLLEPSLVDGCWVDLSPIPIGLFIALFGAIFADSGEVCPASIVLRSFIVMPRARVAMHSTCKILYEPDFSRGSPTVWSQA